MRTPAPRSIPRGGSRLRLTWLGTVAVCGWILLLPARSLAHRCTGDCDGNDLVRVSELVRSVRVALGETPVARCFQIDADRDGGASINELLVAVNNAFTLCGHAIPGPTANTAKAPRVNGFPSRDQAPDSPSAE